jgi:hypothetical protein
MTTDAARRAVFDTPELLENIILCLPVKDVFAKVQRLSRSWKAVVDSSVAIQTKLWLRPRDKTAVQPRGFNEGHASSHVPDICPGSEYPIYPPGVVLNPFSQIECVNFHARLSSYPTSNERPMLIGLHSDTKSMNGYAQPVIDHSHNWRGMYLTEPPITTVMLKIRYQYRTDKDSEWNWVGSLIRDRDGITLGFLHDMCWALVPLNVRDSLVCSSGSEPGRYFYGGLFTFFE